MLEVTSVTFSDMSSTFTSGGGDATFGGGGGDFTFGGGAGDWGLAAIGGGDFLGEAPRFLDTGSGVAGVVERTGRVTADADDACSSLLGGGGNIP